MNDNTRNWDLPAKGPLRYRDKVNDPSLAAFRSLHPASRRKIELPVAGKLLGKDDDEPVTLIYDILKAHWVYQNGVAVNAENVGLRRLLEARLDDEKDALNRMMRAPLIVHQNAARYGFRYESGLKVDRPRRNAGQSLRQWRGVDAKWMRQANSEQTLGKTTWDRLDRAFNIMRGFARPVPMRWLMEVDYNHVTQIRLLTTAQLAHTATVVKRDDIVLSVDTDRSTDSHETRRLVIAANCTALLLLLRQLAADDLGSLVITAIEVDTLDDPGTFHPQFVVKVERHGWFDGVGGLADAPLEKLMTFALDGVNFAWLD